MAKVKIFVHASNADADADTTCAPPPPQFESAGADAPAAPFSYALANKAVGTTCILQALSKPLRRRQGPDPCSL